MMVLQEKGIIARKKKGGFVMAKLDRNQVTPQMIQKAMECKNADELIALARENDIELTQEEAEAYLAELEDIELDEKSLSEMSAAGCYSDCNDTCWSVLI